MARYYFDTEFIEDGKTIDLISIGIVAENGREYYAVNRDCDFSKASDWVLENVLKPMGLGRSGFSRNSKSLDVSTAYKSSLAQAKPKQLIKCEIAGFCGCMTTTTYSEKSNDFLGLFKRKNKSETNLKFRVDENMPTPEFWAYYADYDWVAFCQLFGTMMDLPERFPMYCRDLKQEADRLGVTFEAILQENEHHALFDARWVKKAHEYLLNGCRLGGM